MHSISAVIEKGLTDGLHVGAQLYVSQHGRVICDSAWGMASPDAPMSTESLMLWMSSGKPITAVALARQVEKGLADWDDPVARWIPEFAAEGKEHVTLRHILTHTAGLRLADLVKGETWAERMRAICSVKLESRDAPGKVAAYHVSGTWFLLGEVLHRITGHGIDFILREEIFHPCGMHDCWVGIPEERLTAYADMGGVMMRTSSSPPTPHPVNGAPSIHRIPRPGSNAYGPIRMLGRFYEHLLNGGAPLLQKDTLDYIRLRHREGAEDKTFRAVVDMGLGFILNSRRYGPQPVYGYGDYASESAFGHSGAESSCAFADPDHGLVVAWVCNGMPGEVTHQARAHAINNAIYQDLGLATV